MVLVDTSVWVAHLRHGSMGLEDLLVGGRVVTGVPLWTLDKRLNEAARKLRVSSLIFSVL